MLYLKLEIGYVASGNILSYNTLTRYILPGDWVGAIIPCESWKFCLGLASKMGPLLQCGEGGERRWLDTQLEKIMDCPFGASSYLPSHPGNTLHPLDH